MRTTKPNHRSLFRRITGPVVVVLVLLAIGFALGAGTQRYYGLGRLIKRVFPEHYTRPQFAVPEKFRGKMVVFLLAGQSNMEGTGRLSDYTPPETHGRVFVFSKDYRWRVAREPLDPSGGVGPGVAFAAELLAKDPEMVIGLVPVARGGTTIAQWQVDLSDGALCSEALKRFLAASSMGRMGGVLFSQGEADVARSPGTHAEDWATWFEQMVRGMRRCLRNETLPFVYAQMGESPTRNSPRHEMVRKQQAMVRLANTTMIPTAGLAVYPGSLHYTTSSQVEIGRRFAAAWYSLALSPASSPATSQGMETETPRGIGLSGSGR